MARSPARPAGQPGRPRGPRDARGVVQDQITTAARSSFAVLGWAGTTMRSVARDAGVDPSLVRYYFSSKQALLEASLVFPDGFLDRVQRVARVAPDARGEALVAVLLANWADPEVAATLLAAIQAAAQIPSARAQVELLFRTSVLPLVADLAAGRRQERAALVASQLIGLAVTRYVWKFPPLTAMSDDDLVRAVGRTVQCYLTDPV